MSFQRECIAQFGTPKGGLATVGYQLVNADGTNSGGRITAGVNEDIAGSGIYCALITFPKAFVGRVRWDTGEGSPVYQCQAINLLDGAGPINGLGPFDLTVHLQDALGAEITTGTISIAGQQVGFNNTDGDGDAQFSLKAGNVTINAWADGFGVIAPVMDTVGVDGKWTSNGAQIRNVVLTALSIPPATDPGQTNAYLTTRDWRGQALANVAITFRLEDGMGGVDSFDRGSQVVLSDGAGLLQVALRRGTKYQARNGKGPWVEFVTPDAGTFALPQILGAFSG
jgi:hypothetical protein